MKKTYKLENLDCANCAAKMERSIAKIAVVNEVAINFLTQKMVIEFEGDEVLDEVVRAIKKVDPNCSIAR